MKRNNHLFLTIAVLKCCLAAAFVFSFHVVSYGQRVKPNGAQKPTVLVLATYHMENPGLDLINVQSDNVLTEKRQKEMREFVSLLKRFKPTKIAVEMPIDSTKLDEQ
jgi:hypothetical protein